jgi:hypothetical protein
MQRRNAELTKLSNCMSFKHVAKFKGVKVNDVCSSEISFINP